ncbi:hypothetical protein PTSG_04451 [Salpingoeca rosetta]|uniref:Protein ZIP4 homolog n=1 Tax=Salpingoeca rosetta (strain ATCC 50818 / BSB-021) TaxID=946362 RepID=F2U8L5_SALR5|nr:uncharacterized protein PTSG_04451 [Salpingoeca rosetta]EGD72723.1 hypothetical protein PTSG_04451 [Salpingoeca rosetta]|eukprot:XP_004994546.1 hypothetical protein PTSG_04451 [Salpingoeca rosetta]
MEKRVSAVLDCDESGEKARLAVKATEYAKQQALGEEELYSAARRLWNHTITLPISKDTCQVRTECMHLLMIHGPSHNDGVRQSQMSICMGVGTSWSKLGDSGAALQAFDAAWAVSQQGTLHDDNKTQWLRLLELRTRAALAQKEYQKARVTLQEAAALLQAGSHQERVIAIMHRSALTCLEHKEHTLAHETLSLILNHVSHANQKCQVIRAMSWCTLQLGQPDKALALISAIEVDAISPTEYALSLGLKSRIYTTASDSAAPILNGLGSLLRRPPDATVLLDVVKDMLQALRDHPKVESQHLLEAAHMLQQNLHSSDTKTAALTLLLSAMLDQKRTTDIQSLKEMVDAQLWKQLVHQERVRLALWNAAANAIQEEDVDRALQALNVGNSANITTSMSSEDGTQWQAMRIWCLLRLNRLDEAKLALQQARSSRSSDRSQSSLRLSYLSFRLYILSKDEENARKALLELISHQEGEGANQGPESKLGLLSLAFQDCFEASSRQCARTVLKALVEEKAPHQVLLLRCHLRLIIRELKSLPTVVSTSLLDDVTSTGKQALAACRQQGSCAQQQQQQQEKHSAEDKALDIDWFARMTWNIAVHVSRVVEPRTAAPLFELSFQFDDMMSKPEARRRKARSSLLAAACYVSRTKERHTPSHADAIHAQRAIEVYRSAILDDGSATASSASAPLLSSSSGDPAATSARRERDKILAIILQFDIALTIKDNELLKVWQEARGLSNPLTCYEILAGLALSHGDKQLARSILHEGIVTDTDSFTDKTPLFRSIADILAQLGDDSATLEIARTLATNMEKKSATILPTPAAEDILCVMIKVWNRGIECFSRQDRNMARSLCSVSLRLLKCLPVQQRGPYSTHMSTNFAKIVATRT